MNSDDFDKKIKGVIGDYSLDDYANVTKEPYDSKKFKAAAERVRKIVKAEENDSSK